VIGAADGQDGFFRSDDRGERWVRINDDQHQYGGGSVIIGDPRVYGRAYVGTSGRGIVYGEPKP
jgi:xyloglucan-specific exo-beta-1,4-glucanase